MVTKDMLETIKQIESQLVMAKTHAEHHDVFDLYKDFKDIWLVSMNATNEIGVQIEKKMEEVGFAPRPVAE